MFFSKKETRSRNEERQVEFEGGLLSALIGGKSTITRADALEIPAVQSCVELLAGKISELPLKLYEKNGGKVTEITDDTRIKLLNGDTGDTINATEMRKQWVRDYFLGKGAYTYIDRDMYAMPRGLYYVNESRISAIPNNEPIFKDYTINVDGASYPKSDFIKILRNSKGDGQGISIIKENPIILLIAYNTMRFENSVVKKGGNKKGFLTSENQQTKEAMQSVKEAWRQMFSNSQDVADSVCVLNAGMDFKESSATALEMQLNENKNTNSADICKLFCIPPEIFSGKASEQVKENFISDSVTPLLNLFEAALDSDFLLEAEKDRRYWAFDTRELTRGNILKRYNAYAVGLSNGFLQLDDVRDREDLPPINLPYIKLGLNDVLYNPATKEIYTPNTNAFANLGNGTVMTDEQRAEAELRYNPYHDPRNGRFTSAAGGNLNFIYAGKGTKGMSHEEETLMQRRIIARQQSDFWDDVVEKNSDTKAEFIMQKMAEYGNNSNAKLFAESEFEAHYGKAYAADKAERNRWHKTVRELDTQYETLRKKQHTELKQKYYDAIKGKKGAAEEKYFMNMFEPSDAKLKRRIEQVGASRAEADEIDLTDEESNAIIETRGNGCGYNPYRDEKTGRFTSGEGSGIINTEIDKITPCLQRNSDGSIVNTSFEKISPNKEDFKNWEFDWTQPEKNGYDVYALKADGDNRIQGLIACKENVRNHAIDIDIIEAAPHNNKHNKNNLSKSKEYSGVGGHLFAEAARQSKEKGYGGFVTFVSKTNLISHYKETLGATQIGSSQKMFIDEAAAEILIKKYF